MNDYDFFFIYFELNEITTIFKMDYISEKYKRGAFSGLYYPGGGGGGTQIWFRRGCAAEAARPVPIFKGHFGGKGYPLLRVWRKRVTIIRGFYSRK